jgi:hypothetical protein
VSEDGIPAPQRKAKCGCYVEWRPSGPTVAAEGWVVSASGFRCPRFHEQGAYVSDEDARAMRVAMLVHPAWPAPNRADALAAKLAEKHPGCDMLSAGQGSGIYAAERGALRAGLRVAAFRIEWPEPKRGVREWLDPDDPTMPPEPMVGVVVYELLPDNLDHVSRLWHPKPRRLGEARGRAAAQELAIKFAVEAADEIVVLTGVEDWPVVGWPEGVAPWTIAV